VYATLRAERDDADARRARRKAASAQPSSTGNSNSTTTAATAATAATASTSTTPTAARSRALSLPDLVVALRRLHGVGAHAHTNVDDDGDATHAEPSDADTIGFVGALLSLRSASRTAPLPSSTSSSLAHDVATTLGAHLFVLSAARVRLQGVLPCARAADAAEGAATLRVPLLSLDIASDDSLYAARAGDRRASRSRSSSAVGRCTVRVRVWLTHMFRSARVAARRRRR
jgi:hypothetical protein